MILIQSTDARGYLNTPFGTLEYVIHQGKRDYQEDALLIYHTDKLLLCAVADGIASQNGGATASYKSLFNLLRLANTPLTVDSFISINNTLISDLNALNLYGGGCTIEGFKIDSKGIVGFHIGDSRTYTHIEGKLTQVHEDHKAGRYLINYLGLPDCEPIVTTLSDKPESLLLTTDGANRSINTSNFKFDDLCQNIASNHDNTTAVFLY